MGGCFAFGYDELGGSTGGEGLTFIRPLDYLHTYILYIIL
jgi:hypothetical protein